MSHYPPQGEPIPVQPLYAIPAVPNRPGIITAIGVISIVVAAMSMLGGLITVFYSISRMALAAMSSGPMPPTPVAAPSRPPIVTTQASTAPTVRVYENGFDDDQRPIVLDAIENVHPLSDLRHKQMDRLLAKCGKQMFPVGKLNLEAAIKNGINDSGQSYSNTGNGPDYYVLSKGRVEVNDDRALYDPMDGGEKVRVADDEPEEDTNALSAGEVDALVKKAQQMAAQKLNPQQIAAWTQELQNPNQMLLTSTGKPAKTVLQLLRVTVQADGSALFQTRSGFVSMAQNGGVLFSTSSAAGWAARSGKSPFKVHPGAVTMAIVDAVGGLLLAILLLIAGILVLRQSPRARKLHLLYACIKIPLVILGVIGWTWIIHDVVSGIQQSVGATASTAATKPMAGFTIAFAVVALIYPIALLIVMNTRSVKDYYASGQ
jgi:hypothetical protein